MFLIPYRVDFELPRLPIFTLLICALCCIVFVFQLISDLSVNKSATQFCAQSDKGSFAFVLDKISNGENTLDACVDLISAIHSSNRPDRVILHIAESAQSMKFMQKEQNTAFLVQALNDLYQIYRVDAPISLTAQLMYDPRSFNPLKMISSIFSHSGWLHLLGNLLFFYAFAAAVEIYIGRLKFIGLVFALAILTNLAYSTVMYSQQNALPTLGLSGVVMGVISVFIALMPKAKIRCWFWFVIILRRITLPAWLLGLWNIAWDVVQLNYSFHQTSVNFVAHISGALIGLALGIWFFSNTRSGIRERGE